MTIESIVQSIESSWNGVISGVKILIVGAEDNGLLARTLARHGAKIVMLVSSEAEKEMADQLRPQALDMRINLREECLSEIAGNMEGYDGVVILNSNETIRFGKSVFKIEYCNGEYYKVE